MIAGHHPEVMENDISRTTKLLCKKIVHQTNIKMWLNITGRTQDDQIPELKIKCQTHRTVTKRTLGDIIY